MKILRHTNFTDENISGFSPHLYSPHIVRKHRPEPVLFTRTQQIKRITRVNVHDRLKLGIHFSVPHPDPNTQSHSRTDRHRTLESFSLREADGGAGVSKTVCKTSHSNIQPSSPPPPPPRLIRSTYVSLVINRGNETFFSSSSICFL